MGKVGAPHCIECNRVSMKVSGDCIYPHRYDLHQLVFWKCERCDDSYVGSHKGTGYPLGRPCGKETRSARSHVHKVLDPIWKNAKYKGARKDVYYALSLHMGLKPSKTHVALFDMSQCRSAYCFLRTFKLEDFEVLE